MKHRIKLILIGSSLTLALGACGGDDGTALDRPSDAYAAFMRITCEKAYECMSSFDPAMHNGTTFTQRYGTSFDECQVKYRDLLERFLGPDFYVKLDASVDAGRITYNADDFAVCVAAARALTCDQFFGQNGQMSYEPPECATGFVGNVATGAMCTLDLDCATDGDECDDATMTCTP